MGYKINIQKLMVFLQACNDQFEHEETRVNKGISE